MGLGEFPFSTVEMQIDKVIIRQINQTLDSSMFISNLWNNLNFLIPKDVVFYKFLKYVYSFPRLMPCHHSIDFFFISIIV